MSFNVKKETENIINGIKLYFARPENMGHKAVLGISGGKDSTVAAMLLVEALGSDRVIGVRMPQGDQSDSSDARYICDYLDLEPWEINIDNICKEFYKAFSEKNDDRILTNAPSRIRTNILYSIAAVNNGRVIGTSNACENFVGYVTKGGDTVSDFNPLSHYLVSEIYKIGDYILEELWNDEDDFLSELIHKTPNDGMSGISDEAKLGVSYEEIEKFIKGKYTHLSVDTMAIIRNKYTTSRHKFNPATSIIRIDDTLEDWGL